MTSTYACVPTTTQPQHNPNYFTTAQLQTTRVPSFPGGFHGLGRVNANYPPSPLNPHPRWDPQHHHRSSPALSEPMDFPDPSTLAEPYQEFEFAAGAISSENSSSASSSIRHLQVRERKPGSRSGSGRSVPLPAPLTYGVQKSEEYNPCAHGYHDPDKRKYGKCGIAAAVLLFPFGILCLLKDTSKQCKRCGQKLDSSSTELW